MRAGDESVARREALKLLEGIWSRRRIERPGTRRRRHHRIESLKEATRIIRLHAPVAFRPGNIERGLQVIGEGDADRVYVRFSDVVRDDRMTALIHRRRRLCARRDWRRRRMLLLRIGGAGKRNGQNSNGKGSSAEPGAQASTGVAAAARH